MSYAYHLPSFAFSSLVDVFHSVHVKIETAPVHKASRGTGIHPAYPMVPVALSPEW
jgi:hypothetical protein